MSDVGIFRGAITEKDNRTVSPTFLAVWWAVFVVLPIVLLSMIGLAYVDVIVNKREANLGGLGGGIGAVLSTLGIFVASMVALLWQDKKPESPQATTTTTTTTSVTPPSAPLKVDVVNMPEDGNDSKRKAKA